MRILYSHRIQSHDGQGVHIEELVRALRQAGHEVLVVGPSFYDATGFGGESSTIARLRRLLPGVLGELAELAYNVPAYLKLRGAWKSFRPDFVYERCNLYFLAGAWLARRHKATLLLEVNSPLAEERGKFGGLHLAKLAARLERWTWRSADRVLPVTAVLGDILVSAGVARERVAVVPNGIDLARFPPRPAASGPAVALGFVGFVRAWHGLDRVIEGMAATQGGETLALVVVGDGPARPDLEALAARLGIAGRIRFTGLIQPEYVPAVVTGFDIALQPSATPYASPLKIFDYMAAGCAIVAPDQPNIREILEHGRTAMLFDPAEEGAMWQAVAGLIADPALRRRLGSAAREALERLDYTWAGNARRVAAIASGTGAGPVPAVTA
jgi:glycosyltransferase involved in cell wall biosynthesis